MSKQVLIPPPPPDSGKHTQSLSSLRAVRKEQSRVYRQAVNGRLSSDEAARRIYMLREIRSSLEAEPLPPAEGAFVKEISICSVPQGWQVIDLFGAQAHMPTETLNKLRLLLSDDAFEKPLPADMPFPETYEPAATTRPMLKVFDGIEDGEPEPPLAA